MKGVSACLSKEQRNFMSMHAKHFIAAEYCSTQSIVLLLSLFLKKKNGRANISVNL